MKGNLQDLTTPAMRARVVGVNWQPPITRQHSMFAEPKPLPQIGLPKTAVGLGLDEHSRHFGIDLPELLNGRLLVQGNSGAGKSWLLRKLLEESAGFVQQIILDPEHEYRSLAELFDYPVADASKLDLNGAIKLAERVRALRQSIVIDLSELERDRQMMFVASFLPGLIQASEQHWHPTIVAIDEAHLFAPLGGQGFEGPAVRKRCVSAMVDLMSRGRKRGLTGVLATQRFARLSKSVAAEAMNMLIGINTLDLDIRRAAETIGWDARRAFDRLPLLKPGEFVAVGPAFVPDSPVIATIGAVRSKHLGQTPAIAVPEQHGAEAAAELLGLAELAEQAGAAIEATLPLGARAVREFLRDPAAALASRIVAELRPIYPEGSTIASLAQHFAVNHKSITAAIALLDGFGVTDTTGDPGPGLAVRIHRGMAAKP